jgi:hypothetical protein
MLSFVQSLLSFLMYSIQSQQKTTDGFANLLAPNLCADTDAFLDVYRGGIQRTCEAERVGSLTRFLVHEMHGNKYTDEFWQHEFAVVVVIDTTTNKLHNFYFERNAGSSRSKAELRVSHTSIETYMYF